MLGGLVDVGADAAENRTDLLLFVDVFQEGGRIRAITPVPVLGGAARLRGVGNDHAFWAIDLGQAALQWNCPGGPDRTPELIGKGIIATGIEYKNTEILGLRQITNHIINSRHSAKVCLIG